MANKKISELASSGALTGAELVEVVQGGTNVKTTTQDIADLGGPGGGSGTVTSFSAGNASPLFTTSVATATTTPALSFTIPNQNANTVYAGPTTGAAAAPTFRALVAADIPDISATYYLASNPAGYTSNTGVYLLASGGTLTGANTITGSEANTLTIAGTWTATANNSFQTNIAGSLTARATASDNLIGTKITTTLVAAAATQVLSAIQVNPTFTPGAHSPNRRAIDVRAGWITIGLTGHQASGRGQLDILDDGVADNIITLRNSSGTVVTRFNASQFQMGASNMAIQAQTNSSGSVSGRGWLYSGDLSSSSNVAHLFSVPSGGSITNGTTNKALVRSASTYTISTGTGSYIQYLFEPIYDISGGTQTVGGIYYNPTETTMTGVTHYSFRSSSLTALGGVAVTAPTALWHLGAVTTARASLRIEAGSTTTAPSSPNSGDIWHEGTNNRLMFRQGANSMEVVVSDGTTTAGTTPSGTIRIRINGTNYDVLKV